MARLVALSLCGALASARIHHLVINNDPRFAFSIESFGFYSGGSVDVVIHDVDAFPKDANHRMGFVVYRAGSESDVERQIDDLKSDTSECALGVKADGVVVLDLSDKQLWHNNTRVNQTIVVPGLYDILFVHCAPLVGGVSFQAEIVFKNGDNYLSAGEQPLPILYGVMGAAFFAAFVVWFRHSRAHAADIHKLHHLMTMLVVSKTASLVFEAVMYHYIATTGHSTGWNIAFYIATFLRGILMISVIALIGAGWSLIKPFLSDREKKLLIVALPLQVLSNIAIIITDEWAPGSISYRAWFNVLKLADLFAAAIVLLPILWSIKTLRDAQAADSADEKTRNTLVRLTQFRSFYVMTLAYIYFTRIIVYLLMESLPYSRTWMAPFCEEVATLAFYVFAGYRFRPAADNSDYLQVPVDEDGPSGGSGSGEDGSSRPGATAPSTDGGDDVVFSMSTSSNTRAAHSSQTVAKTKVEAVDLAKERAQRDSDRAAAAGEAGNNAARAPKRTTAVAIADDDANEDDFGLDDEDFDDSTVAAPVPKAVMKQVRKEQK